MAISKLIFNGVTQMDITDTSAVANDVAEDKVFYDVAGIRTTGTASGGGIIIEDTLDAAGGTIRQITAAETFLKTTLSASENKVYTAPTGILWNQVDVEVIDNSNIDADEFAKFIAGDEASIDFSSCYKIRAHAFRYAKIGNSAYFPNVTQLSGAYSFQDCNCQILVLPSLTTSGNQTFRMSAATTIDLGGTFANIGNYCFTYSQSLTTLILRNLEMVELTDIGGFSNTPFASGGAGGTLYVPASLKTQYQQATNWSTLLGYTNNSIEIIEGSQYENYYADGTSTPEPDYLTPYYFDLNRGYVDNGNGLWKLEIPTNTYVDVYEVEAGKKYRISLGSQVGTRFRVIFTTVDVTTSTASSVSGTNIISTNNPTAYASCFYTASEDGYIVIGKDNVGKTGVITYCLEV